MSERQPRTIGERSYSRRELLRAGGRIAAAGAIIWGLNRLEDGVKLKPKEVYIHPLDTHPIEMHPDQPIFANSTRNSLSPEAHYLESAIRSNNPQKLFTQTGAEVFGQNPDVLVAHRAGNSIEAINKAYAEQGVQVFDVDANKIGDKVYASHGLVPSVDLKLLELYAPFVVDVDEWAFKLGRPRHLFKDVVKHVHLLSTKEKPCGVSIELKRGKFDDPTVSAMFDTLESYEIPAIMKFPTPELFESAMTMKMSRNANFILLGTSQAV